MPSSDIRSTHVPPGQKYPGEEFGYERVAERALRIVLAREVVHCLHQVANPDSNIILHGSTELVMRENPRGWFPGNQEADLDVILKPTVGDDDVSPAPFMRAVNAHADRTGARFKQHSSLGDGNSFAAFSREWTYSQACRILEDAIGPRGVHISNTIWRENEIVSAQLPLSFNSKELLLLPAKSELLPGFEKPILVQDKNDFLSGVWARITNNPSNHKLSDLTSVFNVLSLCPHMVSGLVEESSRASLRIAGLCKLAFTTEFKTISEIVPSQVVNAVTQRVKNELNTPPRGGTSGLFGGFHCYERHWTAGFEATFEAILRARPFRKGEQFDILEGDKPLGAFLSENEKAFFDGLVGHGNSGRPRMNLGLLDADYAPLFNTHPQLKDNIRAILEEIVLQVWMRTLA